MAIILVFLEFGHVFALLGDYPKFSTVEGPLQNIPEMGRGHGRKFGSGTHRPIHNKLNDIQFLVG